MKEADFCSCTVAIVGLGLMGGSLAAALSSRHACKQVLGVARRETSLELARDLRYIDRGTTNALEVVSEADVVVLATPVRTIIQQISELGPHLKSGAILTDLGSTKRDISKAMNRLPKNLRAIGGHPMCGKERPGLGMADPNLFVDRTYVMTPNQRTSERAHAILRQLILSVEARPLELDADRHDRIVAAISHLPYMLSISLVSGANAASGHDNMTWQLASSGFRDTSRVAASDIKMMLDILATNTDYVTACMQESSTALGKMAQALRSGDMQSLSEQLTHAHDLRQELYS